MVSKLTMCFKKFLIVHLSIAALLQSALYAYLMVKLFAESDTWQNHYKKAVLSYMATFALALAIFNQWMCYLGIRRKDHKVLSAYIVGQFVPFSMLAIYSILHFSYFFVPVIILIPISATLAVFLGRDFRNRRNEESRIFIISDELPPAYEPPPKYEDAMRRLRELG